MYELYNRNRVILHKSVFTNNAVIKPRGAHIYNSGNVLYCYDVDTKWNS